jgi:hypothetical protein
MECYFKSEAKSKNVVSVFKVRMYGTRNLWKGASREDKKEWIDDRIRDRQSFEDLRDDVIDRFKRCE